MTKTLSAAAAFATLLLADAAQAEPQPVSLPVPPVVLEATAHPQLEVAPYAGTYNYAHTQRPFRWGWFGVERHQPQVHRHSGYYNQPVTWARRRW